ncbi:hypothetical protein Tco_0586393 [Tanacetum coccineum]
MYLTASRPDIMFAVCACARFQVTPKASHLNAVKRIFSDYGGASLDRKSTTGGCQFLGRRMISWQCKKQMIMANSTTEAEYVAAANCCGQKLCTAGINVNTARLSLCCSKVLNDGNDVWIRKKDAAWIGIGGYKCSQTVNDVKQINATIDSKTVVVTEASIRSSLLFNDADGTACLTNEAIFQNLALMGYGAEGAGSREPTESQPTPSPTQPSTGDQPPKTSSSHATAHDSRDSLEGTNRNERDQVQTPHDSPLSGGHTSDRAEDAQAVKTSALKSRIKKLEKKCKPSISHHRAWLKSVKRLSMKKRFGQKESVSKQGRKKPKPESTLDDSTVFDDQDHSMEYMETEEAVDEGRQSGETKEVKLTDDTEVVEDKGSGDKRGNAEELVSTARPDIDAARKEDSMKEEKAKEKGVSIKDVDDSSRPARSILTLKPLPTINPKDKGKGVLKESPVKKVKKSDLDAPQIAKDVEIARLVHEKELVKMEKGKRGKTETGSSICELHCKFI